MDYTWFRWRDLFSLTHPRNIGGVTNRTYTILVSVFIILIVISGLLMNISTGTSVSYRPYQYGSKYIEPQLQGTTTIGLPRATSVELPNDVRTNKPGGFWSKVKSILLAILKFTLIFVGACLLSWVIKRLTHEMEIRFRLLKSFGRCRSHTLAEIDL